MSDFHDLCRLISLILENGTDFQSDILAIVYRILRLSTQSAQTLRIIIETATKTIQSAIRCGNYRGDELHKIIKQINKMTSRDREKSACQRVLASMLVDCLKNRAVMNLAAFFKLLDLLLHDNYSQLMIDEQMETYIFGQRRNEVTSDQNPRLLLTSTLLSHTSELFEILCEKDFQFLFANDKSRDDKLTPSTTQTPLSIIGTSTILSDTLLRNSSIVELKVGIGQLLVLLNGQQIWDSRPVPNDSTSDHIPYTVRLFHENFWVLIGAMSNFCVQPRHVLEKQWEPVLVSSADTMADRIQLILTSYPTLIESKNSNESTSLFYAFSFMQAWTIYSEIVAKTARKNVNITGFWIKITPGILALMSQVSVFTSLTIAMVSKTGSNMNFL